MALAVPEDLFHACLSPTDSSTPVRFESLLAKACGALHVEGFSSIDVQEYEALGHCTRELLSSPRAVSVSHWGGPDEDRIVTRREEGYWRIDWRGETLFMVAAQWREGFSDTSRAWIMGESRE